MNPILWQPSNPSRTQLAAFQRRVCPSAANYHDLHRWSVEQKDEFWRAVWDTMHVLGEPGTRGFVPGPHQTQTRWFPEARLNFAENLLRPGVNGDEPALIWETESGQAGQLSRGELHTQSIAFAQTLRSMGVQAGDRVAAVLPNIPEAVIAMLGTTAIGAIWSCCSPDFGDDAIADRFSQIEPVVLVTAEVGQYAGKSVPVRDKVRRVLPRLSTVRRVIVVGDAGDENSFADTVAQRSPDFVFERFPFDHPVFILYSSGTTGAPKCIVHGAGGTLLQHGKEHQLHSEVRPGDRVFFYTTTGWMMWNWLVTVLASRAAAVLYDGSPFTPDGEVLWQLAERVSVTHFGAGAKYYANLEKQGHQPRERFDLTALRMVLSTGSPLLPEGFDFIYRDIKPDVQLASISGGTDIVSCFVLGCPTEPVRRGEIPVKGLGMDVQVWNDQGQPVIGEAGELVCVTPFPSRPVGFWKDPDQAKYRASYFEVFENVWCHGDWAEETRSGGFIIHGRSDTTLNPGGVRIGTAEIYQQVETFPEILESLATVRRQDGDEQIVLFVRLRPGASLTPELIDAVKTRLKTRCSPRHVPAFVFEAPDFPRTISGKLSEVAVRNAIHGLPIKNEAALANPTVLDFFRTLPQFG